MNYKSIEVVNDVIPNGGSLKISVSIGNDFKSLVGTNLENWGYVEIYLCCKGEKFKCFWDNLNFFLKASEDEIKKECKDELVNKGFYYKGFFKDLQKMIDELVAAGYLTRDCKKDY